MTWFVSGAAMLLLSSCSPQTEKVYTVDELISRSGDADEDHRAVPQQSRRAPRHLNCRNAEAADGRLRLARMRKSLGG
jgi:hypothetical protein